MSGQEIETALRRLGWMGKDLAERLGVTPKAVSSWVTGKVVAPKYVVEYLRVSLLAKEILRP